VEGRIDEITIYADLLLKCRKGRIAPSRKKLSFSAFSATFAVFLAVRSLSSKFVSSSIKPMRNMHLPSDFCNMRSSSLVDC